MQSNAGDTVGLQAVKTPYTKAQLFWRVAAFVIAIDIMTKAIAEYALVPMYTPHPIIGDYLRLTLAYNPGAAFSMYLGEYSRWIFMGLTVVAFFVLGRMYRDTPENAKMRTLALALVSSGAMGNFIDRVRSSQGVVDFVDIGIGTYRFPVFNAADSAVSIGAVILGWVLLQEDRAQQRIQEVQQTSSKSVPQKMQRVADV